jgi:hypothetical protein
MLATSERALTIPTTAPSIRRPSAKSDIALNLTAFSNQTFDGRLLFLVKHVYLLKLLALSVELRDAEITNIPFLAALAGALRRCNPLV